jgi:hypothetical protein
MGEYRSRPHSDKPDEAALHPVGAALLVDVQRGRAVGRERPFGQPVAQPGGSGIVSRPRVRRRRGTAPRAGGGTAEDVRRQDEPDNVVGRGSEQPL